MTRALISELAQRLGKSEEEVIQFFQTLWQVFPPSPEMQPYFFRYLDERFLRLEDRISNLRQEMLSQIEGLRKEMQQGDAALQQQIEALRKEMQQGNAALQQQIEVLRKEMQQGDAALQQQIEALRKEMQQGDAALQQQIEALRKEMHQKIEELRKEMQHNNALLRQEIEALRHHVERVEKWLFALTIPVLVSTLSILVMLFKPS
ncbi:MAG: hypothetical protein RMK89_05195 [Armatimonadota bacterium]|nr:hypothetical protein [Armatimonadota bacterium]MDW8142841.1 hypothetical protein [Armatimonadota bacterium]